MKPGPTRQRPLILPGRAWPGPLTLRKPSPAIIPCLVRAGRAGLGPLGWAS